MTRESEKPRKLSTSDKQKFSTSAETISTPTVEPGTTSLGTGSSGLGRKVRIDSGMDGVQYLIICCLRFS